MRRESCDVLVIGCGAAGSTAALAALEAGASVLVLERAPREERGGNTRWTEALLRLGSGQRVSDDFVEAYTQNAGYHIAPSYVAEAAQPSETWSSVLRTLPFLDPELLDAFASSVPSTLQWLASHGVRFGTSVYPFIFHAPLHSLYGGGLALVETLCDGIERRGGRFLYETTAMRLRIDDALRVVGVVAADRAHGAVLIDAGRVVLACGGFEGNSAMVVQYLGPAGRYLRPVAPGGWHNKGEGIRMALDAGAAPAGDYAECHRQPIDPRSSVSEALVSAYPLGIVVNQSGTRFMDEAPSDISLYTEDSCRQINQQPDGIAYFVYDAQIDDVKSWRRMLRTDQPPIVADTLAELAAKIRVPADALAETVRAYNRGCRSDGRFAYRRADDFAAQSGEADARWIDAWADTFDGLATEGVHPPKSNWARPLSRPPFGCYPIISSNTFTFGGVKTTKEGEVVSTAGSVIPGLYAAGETMGMIYGTYVGATSVLRGLVFGRRAGAHAAASVLGGRS